MPLLLELAAGKARQAADMLGIERKPLPELACGRGPVAGLEERETSFLAAAKTGEAQGGIGGGGKHRGDRGEKDG